MPLELDCRSRWPAPDAILRHNISVLNHCDRSEGAGSSSCCLGLPCGFQGPTYLSHLLLSTRCSSRELEWRRRLVSNAGLCGGMQLLTRGLKHQANRRAHRVERTLPIG